MSVNCPVCSSESVEIVLEVPSIPVFCNVQYESQAEAVDQPVGDMSLSVCRECSHFFNSSFDESLLKYGQSYENSLHFSPTFGYFAKDVASRLVEQHGLRGKRVVDIGCGKGDFLSLICELGENNGYGFDQSYEEGRVQIPTKGSVQYFREHYGPGHEGIEPSLVTCRHVLEHIPEPPQFLTILQETLGNARDCSVYFEVPNALYTIRDFGIWDLIYEHCQYFTEDSLRTLFEQSGFSVGGTYESFGGQFLGLDGRVHSEQSADTANEARGISDIGELARSFKASFDRLVGTWSSTLRELDGPVVIWGGGSKGVTFLNMIECGDKVVGVVDINPHKQGMYVTNTGHEIIAPEELARIAPSHVLVMNPLYETEIKKMIASMDVDAKTCLVN